jgi:membrane protease YdiL (CAAX protease family)
VSIGTAPDPARHWRPLVAFDTPPGAASWKRWLLYSPLARIVIFAAVTTGLGFLLQLGFGWLGWSGKATPMPQRGIAFFFLLVLPALSAYLFLVCVVEQRRPAELAWRKVLPHAALGNGIGVLLISAVVGLLWLMGSYSVVGTHPAAPWVGPLLIGGLASAIAEELMMRGVLFRIAEEGLGTWAALVLSALVFGLLHIGNPGATVWSSVAIAIEAGLLLGLIYHLWRSLPLCIGVHMGWNFVQGTVYGIPVSGAKSHGWLISARSGPDWLSGGSFGVEASVVAVGVSLLCSLVLLALAWRRHTLVVPRFTRVEASSAPQGAG